MNQPNEPLCISALPALLLRLRVSVAHMQAKNICSSTGKSNEDQQVLLPWAARPHMPAPEGMDSEVAFNMHRHHAG